MKIKSLASCLMAFVLSFGSTACSSKRNVSQRRMSTTTAGANRPRPTSAPVKSDKPKAESSNAGAVSQAHKSVCAKLGLTPAATDNQKLYAEAASWLGTKYKYGGTDRSGVDCSGLTLLIYKAVYGVALMRSSADMLASNCKAISKGQLREGDLVFFRTDGKASKTPNHVGIYLKDNMFIHSSTSKGVVVSSMAQDYYVKTFITAGRVSRK